MGSIGGSSAVVTLYTDAACTQAATAQQVIDAFSAGGVRILLTSDGSEEVMTVISIAYPTVSATESGGGTSPAANLFVLFPDTKTIRQLNLME